MNLSYTLEIIPDVTGGYVVHVKELAGCITTAETWEEIPHMLDEAKQLWLEVALENGELIPEPEQEKAH